MCIYHSVALRNAVVEENLWCIDAVIRKNHALMQSAHLDYDDVYQWLALRMIQAVATFDPDKGVLRQHLFAQLHYEIRICRCPLGPSWCRCIFGMFGRVQPRLGTADRGVAARYSQQDRCKNPSTL